MARQLGLGFAFLFLFFALPPPEKSFLPPVLHFCFLLPVFTPSFSCEKFLWPAPSALRELAASSPHYNKNQIKRLKVQFLRRQSGSQGD